MLVSIIISLSQRISQITIEIVYARNPVIRNWFTDPEAAKQIAPYLTGIQLSGPECHQNEIVGIDMAGRFDLVENFQRKFLSDEGPEVYGLPFRD